MPETPEVEEIILRKFFVKYHVVERPRWTRSSEFVAARWVTEDELKALVRFAFEQGLKEKRKRKKLERAKT